MNLGDRVLYKGCQGADVEQLQKLLAKLGYDIIISEYFGDRTEKAVIKFQNDNELKPDGRVSGITLLKIKLKS
ncbi:peptidoglycan-binding protein [Flavobacterium hydrophilum]|uniref:Peptidoglycan-binding protein n=2 Tax=Flavobacterium hydrophilum TaxID=2211445 RepID=A0A2V4C7L8_9FLAO|nr:peptidoglycan-binding protein [Flavobacterium hydrophilum]